jgi:glycosyltransferase involved in cell wall biosynthesis
MNVLFINENTLGHTSYLRPFTEELERRPELNIRARWLDATPLPPELEHKANRSVRGLRHWGLDFGHVRWRRAVSGFVRGQVLERLRSETLDAIVVNTQSIALGLAEIAATTPVLVCLDATFRQLARTGWFAPAPSSRWLGPLLLAPLSAAERRLFSSARRLLPWSTKARHSLENDYGLPGARISVLPPSVTETPARARPTHERFQILFVGGDFARKGGPLLLQCFREHFAARCELHIVTQSPVQPEPGVLVHRGLGAHSPEWLERWTQADVFVFPSRLETFGIVLVEALAFGVPVVAAATGAASEVLANGAAGLLLTSLSQETLRQAIHEVLANPDAARQRAEAGRGQVRAHFDLATNTQRLAAWLREGAESRA